MNFLEFLYNNKIKTKLDAVLPKHLQIAFGELGQAEIVGISDNPRIVEYQKTTKTNIKSMSDEVPWCSSFVNWVLVQSGFKGTDMANARSFLSWGKSLDKPKIGDIVIFSRGNEPWQGHVAFFLDKSNGLVFVLGGNQSNRVGINGYQEGMVLGYRSPNLT